MSWTRLTHNLWYAPLPSRTMPPFDSTNTYLIADGPVGLIVDPGFETAAALASLRAQLDALGVRFVKAVLLTHTHPDHVAGLELVTDALGEPAVYVHPLEAERLPAGLPIRALQHERVLMAGDVDVKALHTPGHSPGHLAFHLPGQGAVIGGDLVAGSGSVWVGVPEGDVSAYLGSLDLLASLPGTEVLAPGHGEPSSEPHRLLRETRAHRLERERQILAALAAPRELGELRGQVYPDVPAEMSHLVDATLLAHLRKLMNELKVVHLGEDESGPFVKSL